MPLHSSPALHLASRSPRRAELLRLLGVEFAVVGATVDEQARPHEAPDAYVSRIALAKAAAGRHGMSPSRIVLAADTTVSVDGAIFGKPRDRADGLAMLRLLSGRWHDVHTAVVVVAAGEPLLHVVSTEVEFATLDEAMIDAYWRSGEPADKAGSYGIQGLGGALVRRIEGSYSAVVGLPLCETAGLLDAVGVGHALRRG